MSKKWKVSLTNWFLERYVAKYGRLQKKEYFDSNIQFNSIVIYSTTALGDFMFNTPAIRAIRERYPEAYITLVAHQKNSELVEHGKYYDRVVYWNNKIKTVPTLVKILREKEPDLAVILHSHLPYDVISAVMSGVKYIIRDNYSSGISGLEKWLTNYVFHYYGHFVRRKLELISVLGCRSDDPRMEIPVSYQAGKKNPSILTVGFQLGASTESRCWPVSHYVKLANMLISSIPGIRIVLIGGPTDTGKAEQFTQQIDASNQSFIDNRIGKTGLQELITLIDSFDLLVTGDTGPLHLAVALKIKTISLFVTADPRSTGPIQDIELHHIIHKSRTGYTMADEAESPMGVIQPYHVRDAIFSHLQLNQQDD
ncbi:glycosyltransferase family 9 protein [Erwinia persicina]|uniref:glycosyltransferase family 9 protein n=1 Tax=Erwinia persicina TaxID=55211 RepID=UPI0039B0AACC